VSVTHEPTDVDGTTPSDPPSQESSDVRTPEVQTPTAQESTEQESTQQDQAEQDQAEQDQAEQDQAEQDQAEQDQAEQDQAGQGHQETPRQDDSLPVVRGLRVVGRPLTLIVLAVLLAVVGTFFQVRAAQARAGSAAGNQALVDTGRTTQVVGDVSDALNRIFSYSYDDTTVTQQAARQVLTGAAAGQYETLFAQVRAHAAAQRLTLTTRVVSAGVTSLEGDKAQLLVFLDQIATRNDTGQGSASAAQLAISAQRQGTHWLITDIQSR
jgi:Mce-associated membrane protein